MRTIVGIDDERMQDRVGKIVSCSVEGTLNAVFDAATYGVAASAGCGYDFWHFHEYAPDVRRSSRE